MKGNKEIGRLRTQQWEIEVRNRLCSSLRRLEPRKRYHDLSEQVS